MKVLLVAINSKYIHTNLAVRYLRQYSSQHDEISIAEYTINQRVDEIAADIYRQKADIIGLSTYIWNVQQVLDTAEILKAVNPDVRIILGGPEVSFDPIEILKGHEFIEAVVYGEGEETFKEILEGKDYKDIAGLAFRSDGTIKINPSRPVIDEMERIPFPYTEEDDLRNKIAYYEASRGCPFNCSFCLSSTIKGVRFLPLERVYRDLSFLMNTGAKQIKFVDRTFNANKEFAKSIMKFIEYSGTEMTGFHAEITAHLVDDEQLQFLKGLKKDLFQFEIGVQSTNTQTIDSIDRTTDFEKLKRVASIIGSYKNIHQHLDLIAGLPYEDYNSFGNSFNDLYEIQPEKIQLGFLKLLKGSRLRNEAEKYGIRFIDKAPYEVIETKWLSYDDLLKLKDIEELVERYYNEKMFQTTLNCLIPDSFGSAFEFFEDFSNYWRVNNLFAEAHGKDALYSILQDYMVSRNFKNIEMLKDSLRFDYTYNNKGKSIPQFLRSREYSIGNLIHQVVKQPDFLELLLPEDRENAAKEIIKKVKVELFNWNFIDPFNSKKNCQLKKEETAILFYNGRTVDITEILREVRD